MTNEQKKIPTFYHLILKSLALSIYSLLDAQFDQPLLNQCRKCSRNAVWVAQLFPVFLLGRLDNIPVANIFIGKNVIF